MGAASAIGARRRNENDIVMGMGAARGGNGGYERREHCRRERRHNENDVTMAIAGL